MSNLQFIVVKWGNARESTGRKEIENNNATEMEGTKVSQNSHFQTMFQ
jgi:hypothetical protein